MPNTIESIYRYPIKGLSGESLDRIALSAGCVISGDREYAFARSNITFDPANPQHIEKKHFIQFFSIFIDVYSKENKSFFEENGYLKLTNILDTKQITFYDKVYSDFIYNKYDTSGLRSDLSGKENKDQEYITQIMLPSKILPSLEQKTNITWMFLA